MIKINNKELKDYKIEIYIDPLTGIINGKKVKTKTPYIRIIYEEKAIDIETTYPIKWLNELKINTEVDLKNYISEILFVNDEDLYESINKIEESKIKKLELNKYELYIKAQDENNNIEFYEEITIEGE